MRGAGREGGGGCGGRHVCREYESGRVGVRVQACEAGEEPQCDTVRAGRVGARVGEGGRVGLSLNTCSQRKG